VTINDERRIAALYTTHTSACWAREALRILADMATDHDLPAWYIEEVRRIRDGISIIKTREEDSNAS